MKTTRYDDRDLYRVLGGMATDRAVCARVAGQWAEDGLFDSLWANMVGEWCVGHLRKYDAPPDGQLRSIYERWAATGKKDEETVKGAERFLAYCSDEFTREGPFASEYLIDVAGRYFNKVRLRRTLDEAGEDLAENKTEKAWERVAGLNRVELGTGSMFRPAASYEEWREAFELEGRRPLIDYPGELDVFLGRAMVRESLIAFMAPDKAAKSYWLQDATYRALSNRLRVAYFEAGDLTRNDVLLRLGERAARRPRRRGAWKVPKSVRKEGAEAMVEVLLEERRQDKGLSAREAFLAFRRACRSEDAFRLSIHWNSSIDAMGIGSILHGWEREGWVADVVVIDYADILAPPAGFRDPLDQIDATWKHLRRLSQEHHCLVLTATQSNAAAYHEGRGMLTRRHFSGRKTKLAHVSGMLGLNVTAEDKERGVTRVNWVVRRDGAYNDRQAVVVAGCLAIANPAIRSCR